jgi:histidinol phosphatase-like PHP family hydrolase
MIDLHTHTLLSDGELLPLELARRAKVKGYRTLGISDHVDVTTIEHVAASILKLLKYAELHEGIRIVAGAELTHCPAKQIGELTAMARSLGFSYVVVHGETIAEPVEEGTNAAAIEAGVDILAHPGLITPREVEAARDRGVLLEITTRKGHSLTNGHVAKLAGAAGAKLVINTDSHSPSDLTSEEEARRIVLGAGLSPDDFSAMQANAMELVKRAVEKGR